MKNILSILLLLISSVAVAGAAQSDDMDAVWGKANTAYINANYVEAIDGYESILDSGMESAALYLNLGNAYFKRGMNGKAILNYHRALRLSPSMEDADYNLAVANARVQDKIDAVPVFFIARWVGGLKNAMSGNAWAAASLVLLALVMAAVITYMLSERIGLRKTGFYGGILCAIAMIFSMVFASDLRRSGLHPDEAIVMAGAVAVKSSPDAGSKDIFILHEGTKLRVLGALGDYREIMIADGNRGWLTASSIELID